MNQLLNDRDLSFLLFEFLQTESLLSRPRYQEHSREIFDATLNTAKNIAEKYFANHNSLADQNEPKFDGEKIVLVEQTKPAWDAFAEAGFLAAHHDFDNGGMQLPEVVLRAALAYFGAANIATTCYSSLTIGAANLLNTFGSEEQKSLYLPAMLDGRASGTMALTEPGQGSALADIKTTAQPQEDGSYRLFGNKMYISGGDHELTENIFHFVIARIQDAPAGAKGISLFIVPKYLVDSDGKPCQRNDVNLAGLLHKMGFRNTTSTVLNFGENAGAIGYLVGKPNHGLSYMFQMMNEARIAVGAGAAILAYQGFNYSLDYARERPQGRLPSERDPLSKQINIIQHADVKRLLLSQKAFAEGGMALCFYASSLMEDHLTGEDDKTRAEAFLLLDFITPMVKSWPSKYGLKANENAIQVLGGAGYVREYPVEQYYRDNRLNPIHEGTEGIHGLDLLGRKVLQQNGKGYRLIIEKITETCSTLTSHERLSQLANQVQQAVIKLDTTTKSLIEQMSKDIDQGLANATEYLDVFGKVLVSWLWLRQAQVADSQLQAGQTVAQEEQFYRGKIQAAKYYIEWELVQIDSQCQCLLDANTTCFQMQPEWF